MFPDLKRGGGGGGGNRAFTVLEEVCRQDTQPK